VEEPAGISGRLRSVLLEDAVMTASTVRRLITPIAQINIARQQVNVAGNVSTGQQSGSGAW